MMAEQNKEKLSAEIKVSIEDGVASVGHSDAYNAQQERFFAGEKFTKQEKLANNKLIEAEDAQMAEARRDPVAFIKQQQAKNEHDEKLQDTAKAVATPEHAELTAAKNDPLTQKALESLPNDSSKEQGVVANASGHDKQIQLSEDQRLERSKQAFADAAPSDRTTAENNLIRLQQQLLSVAQYTNMTPEQLALAQKKAYMDQGDKLHELNETANKKANALTWEVANFSQGAGKTMLNANVGGSAASVNVGGEVHRGVKVPGLDLAEVNASASTTNEGVVSGSVGVRAVKSVYSQGDHNVFLAAAADMTATNLSGDDTKLGGTATGLVVNTHTLNGRPTSEIGGAKVDLLTGDTTAIGTISQTFNADTKYATTARAIGTVGLGSGSGSFSFETYQRTGIEGLTASANVGVADVGGKNEPSAGLGVSYGW